MRVVKINSFKGDLFNTLELDTEVVKLVIVQVSFLEKIRSKEGKSIIFNSDGSVARDDSEEGLDNAITQLLVKMPKRSANANTVVLSDEKIPSLHEK